MTFARLPITDKEVVYESVLTILDLENPAHVFLERAIPMAMGAKHAFNYGRNFMVLELAVKHSRIPCTYVEPSKWTKVVHEGISADLKPKAKSAIAIKRLLPNLELPTTRTGKLDEGVVDAVLIALYGARILG